MWTAASLMQRTQANVVMMQQARSTQFLARSSFSPFNQPILRPFSSSSSSLSFVRHPQANHRLNCPVHSAPTASHGIISTNARLVLLHSFLTPKRCMSTAITLATHPPAAAPSSSFSLSTTASKPPTSLQRNTTRPFARLLARNVWFLPARKVSANSSSSPSSSVSSTVLSSIHSSDLSGSGGHGNGSGHMASMSGSQLFDASHLLSGLHEDKKERLRCLEVNDSGQHRDVEFSRAELSAMLELHPRDLRFLDSSMRNLPSILARRRVIIVNLEMFKALITADRVLMFDPWYPHVQSVVQPLQAAVLNGGELYDGQPVPFEFIALEHILLTVCRNLEDRFDLYISSLEPLLSSSSSHTAAETEANDSIPSPSNCPSAAFAASVAAPPSFTALVAEGSGSTLMHLLQLKNGLTSFEVTLRETAAALRDLLETDEDMAQMYLSVKKHTGFSPAPSEHTEVEVILETYLRKVDELENEVEQNVKSITLTEEHIQIRLDSNRNSMMKMELLASISTLGVTTAALGAGLFGMNLPSHLEGNPYAFWAVTSFWIVLAAAIVRKGLKLASRRGIDLFQIEPKEPRLHLTHLNPNFEQAANGTKLNKQRRLAKLQMNNYSANSSNTRNSATFK